MPQISLYIDEATLKKIERAARKKRVSISKWVAEQLRARLDADPELQVLVLDAETGEVVDLDLRGTPDEVAERAAHREAAADQAVQRQRGRPRLGVVGREVTLLPRHWDWLGAQPGGASATLRRLVDQARKQGAQSERTRRTQDRAYRFMLALAGDRPGYEEAVRALYARDLEKLAVIIADWPADVRDHVLAIVRNEA